MPPPPPPFLVKALVLLSLSLLLLCLQLAILVANLDGVSHRFLYTELAKDGKEKSPELARKLMDLDLETESKRVVAEDTKNDGGIDWTDGETDDGNWRDFATEFSVQWPSDLRRSHPLENSCKFPLLEPDEPDLLANVRHFRRAHCPPVPTGHLPLVAQLRTGQILFGLPHRSNISRDAKIGCWARELSGTLRPRVRQFQLLGTNWTRIPPNRILELGWEQFVVKCYASQRNGQKELVFHDAFTNIVVPSLRSPSLPQGKVSQSPAPAFGISLFIIDSTARTQFLRHMPLSAALLQDSGFRLMTGYTKIGDNSAINLLAVLAGMVYEPVERGFQPEWFTNGSVLTMEAIRDRSRDFWQAANSSIYKMAELAGYATLWNDEIATSGFGLFHYNAFRGFLQPPAQHYFRPYYEYIYQRLRASSGCLNGELAAPRFIDIWERFASKYASRPQLALNFLTGLTHASANSLELLDGPLSEALGRLKAADHFERNFVVLMGDHGQRISAIQQSRSGRVEERMPLLAISVPPAFERQWPEKVVNLEANQNRLLSNFDLYQTLVDILLLSASHRPRRLSMAIQGMRQKQPGLSLFGPVPRQRSCADSRIPHQFCCCMEQGGASDDDAINRLDINSLQPRLQRLLLAHLTAATTNLHCLQLLKGAGEADRFSLILDVPAQFRFFRLNEQARAGVRSPAHLSRLQAAQPGGWRRLAENVLELEFNATLEATLWAREDDERRRRSEEESGNGNGVENAFVNGTVVQVRLLARFGLHSTGNQSLLLIRGRPLLLGWRPPVPGACQDGRENGREGETMTILTLDSLCPCLMGGIKSSWH